MAVVAKSGVRGTGRELGLGQKLEVANKLSSLTRLGSHEMQIWKHKTTVQLFMMV